ncbi:hypothetical protein SteCoe_14028 [Stentor coeruleus]|uniref:LisH domain-containing protein n=1 Tax=Stentor coeruleus TaxID=5963 RepID=A0A1R2C770_9CILI|nr:hypothetical protein SteCoe_14028 [Stentor coeruleus]
MSFPSKSAPNFEDKLLEELDNSGFIFEMKVKLLDEIFTSLKNVQKDPIIAHSKPINEFDSDVGKLACALIFDFLEQFNLKTSIKTLKYESYLPDQKESIKNLEISLQRESHKNCPLLLEIINNTFGAGEDDEEIGSEIQESIESMQSTDRKEDNLVESAGTSQGYDQSVNSLAMEDFDYVEVVKKL